MFDPFLRSNLRELMMKIPVFIWHFSSIVCRPESRHPRGPLRVNHIPSLLELPTFSLSLDRHKEKNHGG